MSRIFLAFLLAISVGLTFAQEAAKKPPAKKTAAQKPASKPGARQQPTPEQIRKFNELQKKQQ